MSDTEEKTTNPSTEQQPEEQNAEPQQQEEESGSNPQEGEAAAAATQEEEGEERTEDGTEEEKAAAEPSNRTEKDLADKVAKRRAEVERLKAILARRDEEVERVKTSNEEKRAAEEALDSTLVRRDELAAKKASLASSIQIAGDAEAINTQIEEQQTAAAGSDICHVWEETSKRDAEQWENGEKDITGADIGDLPARLEKTKAEHERLVARVVELMKKSEDAKAELEASEKATIKAVNNSFEGEKQKLASTRKRLKALETEQHYHIRRGTYIKDPQNNQGDKDIEAEMQVDLHSQTCAAIVDEKELLERLTDDVRALKKDVDLSQKRADEERGALQAEIDEARSTAEEMEWERELLSLEQEDLAAVKKELIAVTAAVKQQRK